MIWPVLDKLNFRFYLLEKFSLFGLLVAFLMWKNQGHSYSSAERRIFMYVLEILMEHLNKVIDL